MAACKQLCVLVPARARERGRHSRRPRSRTVRESQLRLLDRAPDPLGLAGIWMSVTPRCESASSTAPITAGAAAIVPVSPTPFTPSGFVGLGVSVRATSNNGSSTAEGTR